MLEVAFGLFCLCISREFIVCTWCPILSLQWPFDLCVYIFHLATGHYRFVSHRKICYQLLGARNMLWTWLLCCNCALMSKTCCDIIVIYRTNIRRVNQMSVNFWNEMQDLWYLRLISWVSRLPWAEWRNEYALRSHIFDLPWRNIHDNANMRVGSANAFIFSKESGGCIIM